MSNPSSSNELFQGLTKAAEQENQETDNNAIEAAEASADDAEADTDNGEAEGGPSELEVLKNRARLMGISFSNNISVDTLRARIQAKMESEQSQPQQEQSAAPEVQETQTAPQKGSGQAENLTPMQRKMRKRKEMIKEQMRLVRVRITNMNPDKAQLPGEIFTVANEVLGTVRKFIPYGESTDNGYHIPYCIYQQLKQREFLQIRVTKDSRGREVVKTRQVREFSLEELPQLTPEELARLAAAQAAAGGLED